MDDPNEDRRPPPPPSAPPDSPGFTVHRLRDKVTYYEKLSSGRRDERDEEDEQQAVIDVQAFEQRLQEERAARRALDSPRIDVRLRSTPHASPARRIDLSSSSSSTTPGNLNVKVNVYSTPQPQATNVTISTRSHRPTDDSYEECIERSYDGGEVVGAARVFTFEKITLKKTVREVSVQRPPVHSRTPSEERVFHDDSAYHTHGSKSQRTSKSSSVASLSERFPSEEQDLTDGSWAVVGEEDVRTRTTAPYSVAVGNLTKGRQQSTPDRRVATTSMDLTDEAAASSQEWYNEYRTHSFQKVAAKMSYNRTNSQYDTHIKEIRGWFFFHFFFHLKKKNSCENVVFPKTDRFQI